MKLLWAHDHVFLSGENKGFYSEVEFPYSVWERYLNSFDSLIVAARVKPLALENQLDRLNVSSGPNVEFVSVPSLNDPIRRFSMLRQAKQALINAIGEVDAVIGRLPSEIGSLAVEAAVNLNKPWAVELVGCPWDALWNLNSWKGKLYAPYATYRTKKLLKTSTHVMYVTSDFLQKRYPSKGVTESCSNVNIPNLDRKILERRITFIGDHERNRVKIGLIGYLSHYKGIDTAIKAFKIVKNKFPLTQLEILGGGDSDSWVKEAIHNGLSSEDIAFRRLPSGKPVLQWLDSIDVYIQPSRTEGLPRGLIEAMSRGCPALASNVGGIPELLEFDYLHKPGDAYHLGRLLNEMLSSKSLQIQQAKVNFEKANEYTMGNLTLKRRDFWGEFAKHVERCKS